MSKNLDPSQTFKKGECEVTSCGKHLMDAENELLKRELLRASVVPQNPALYGTAEGPTPGLFAFAPNLGKPAGIQRR